MPKEKKAATSRRRLTPTEKTEVTASEEEATASKPECNHRFEESTGHRRTTAEGTFALEICSKCDAVRTGRRIS